MSPHDVSPSSILVGRDETHLCSLVDADEFGAGIHAAVVEPFRALRAAAAEAGFDLKILSGFRSFGKQLSIWNRKANGALPVLGSDGRPLDIKAMGERDLVLAILRWSALPGASRHHWGTDVDVFDAAARPPGYEIELIPAEVDAGGMFAPLHEWLDERIAGRTAFGFERPYDRDRGGVAPERWHLSYEPLASVLLRSLTTDLLRRTIAGADMALKSTVLRHLDELCERFVRNVNPAAD